MPKIDLHMHTTASDGKLSPNQIVDWAIEKGMYAISITDHDNVDGLRKAVSYAKGKKLIVVSGVEITANPKNYGADLHIVGLFVEHLNKDFDKMAKEKKKNSRITAGEMIKKLQEAGFKITLEELDKATNKKHYGRPHIAELLMLKHPQRFIDRKQVFNEFLGTGKKAHVPPIAPSLKEVIDFIHKQKGLAIIAHPWFFKDKMVEVLNLFVSLGGDGVEVASTPREGIPVNMESILRKFAKDKKLVVSGGTDFHAKAEDKMEIGERGISLRDFNKLLKRHKQKFL